MRYLWILIFLTGCASQEELAERGRLVERLVEIQKEATIATPPILIVDCTNGCGKARIEMRKEMKEFIIPNIIGTNEAIVNIFPSAMSAVKFLGGAFAATRMVNDFVSAAGGNNVTTHNTTSVIGDNNSTTASTSLSETSHNGITDSHDVNSSDNSVSNNDDNSVVNNDDNSVDNTHTPTVVNPVIVTQPAPVIVQ